MPLLRGREVHRHVDCPGAPGMRTGIWNTRVLPERKARPEDSHAGASVVSAWILPNLLRAWFKFGQDPPIRPYPAIFISNRVPARLGVSTPDHGNSSRSLRAAQSPHYPPPNPPHLITMTTDTFLVTSGKLVVGMPALRGAF